MHNVTKVNPRNARRMRENIAEVYSNATPKQISDGESWYTRANELAHNLSDVSGLPMRSTSGIIAILSPKCSWERNKTAAIEICEGREKLSVPIIGGFRAKAEAIRDGGDPDFYVRGQKVRSFWEIIENPQSSAVCIDVHAFAIASGRITSERERKVIERVGMFDFLGSLYRDVADYFGMIPNVIQAITWVTWREHFQYAKVDGAVSF